MQTFSHHAHDPEIGPLQKTRHRQRRSRSHKVLEESQQECCPPSIGIPTRNTVSDWPKKNTTFNMY